MRILLNKMKENLILNGNSGLKPLSDFPWLRYHFCRRKLLEQKAPSFSSLFPPWSYGVYADLLSHISARFDANDVCDEPSGSPARFAKASQIYETSSWFGKIPPPLPRVLLTGFTTRDRTNWAIPRLSCSRIWMSPNTNVLFTFFKLIPFNPRQLREGMRNIETAKGLSRPLSFKRKQE